MRGEEKQSAKTLRAAHYKYLEMIQNKAAKEKWDAPPYLYTEACPDIRYRPSNPNMQTWERWK